MSGCRSIPPEVSKINLKTLQLSNCGGIQAKMPNGAPSFPQIPSLGTLIIGDNQWNDVSLSVVMNWLDQDLKNLFCLSFRRSEMPFPPFCTTCRTPSRNNTHPAIQESLPSVLPVTEICLLSLEATACDVFGRSFQISAYWALYIRLSKACKVLRLQPRNSSSPRLVLPIPVLPCAKIPKRHSYPCST